MANAPLIACPFCAAPAEHQYKGGVEKVGCFNVACPIKPKAASTCENTAREKWNTRRWIGPVGPGWIPVAERIPDSNRTVLIYSTDRGCPVWIGYYDAEYGYWRIADGCAVPHVLQWMELPAAPGVPA